MLSSCRNSGTTRLRGMMTSATMLASTTWFCPGASFAAKGLDCFPILYHQARAAVLYGISLDPQVYLYFFRSYTIDYLLEISAAAHQGTRELVKRAAQELQQLPPVVVYEPTYVERPPEVDTNGSVSIEKFDDTWVVEAPWLQQLIASVNFGDFESRNWFDQKLRQSGLFDKLEEMGIQDGDIVSMYNLEFEYQR